MENQLIKNVLERLVEIDARADQLEAEGKAYQDAVHVNIKRRVHAFEIDLMKDVRTRVKTNFQSEIEKANGESDALTARTAQNIENFNRFFEEHKDSVVDMLFNDIFGV